MDLIQNGESSKSPRQRAFSPTLPNGKSESHGNKSNEMNEMKIDTSSIDNDQKSKNRLILPEWDIPEPRHIHPSHDLISILQLDNLYQIHLKPFAELILEERIPNDSGGGGVGGSDDDGENNINTMVLPPPVNKNAPMGSRARGRFAGRRKMEKGYLHLIADCIDPTPTGEAKSNNSLIPLLGDFMQPPTFPPTLIEEPIRLLDDEVFNVAKLEVGHKEQGYDNGQKNGVKEAELKRQTCYHTKDQRKHQRQNPSISLAPETAVPSPSQPTHAISSPLSPGHPPAPPQHFPRPPFGRASGTPRGSGFNLRGHGHGPGTPGRGGGFNSNPGNPGKRPFEGGQGGYSTPKRGKPGYGPGSRGSSEVPLGTASQLGSGTGSESRGFGQGMQRGRGGMSRGRGGAWRSKTEG